MSGPVIFIAGLLIGAFVGALVICILVVGRDNAC